MKKLTVKQRGWCVSRPLWEIFVGKQNKVTTVGRLLNGVLKPVDMMYQEVKEKINKAKYDDGSDHLRCCHCNNGLYGRRSKQGTGATLYYFCHYTPTDETQKEKVLSCPYYTGNGGDIYSDYCSDVENEWRINNKYNVIEALENSPVISSGSIVNSQFVFSKDDDENTRRKPDIYFEDERGNKWAIEFYRSWITTEVVYRRESFFRGESINLLWLFPAENKFNSELIADYIMFGSNKSYLSVKNNNRAANNVFYFDGNQLQSTNKNNELTVLARYPVISFLDNNRAEVEFLTKEVLISEMSLAPEYRLPWAVDTKYNHTQYRNDIAHRLIRLRKAYHYCKSHLIYNEVSFRVLSSLKQIIRNVSDIDYDAEVEKTINRYLLRLHSYIKRSGISTNNLRNATAKQLKSAYKLYRILKSKPLRKIKEKEVNNLARLCDLISDKGLSSPTYNNIQSFKCDLVIRFKLYQQQQHLRGREAEALIKFRKLYNRMRSYDLFPIKHLTKVNEIRRGFEFVSVSPQTGKMIATKNGEMDVIVSKTKRHKTANNALLIRTNIKAINACLGNGNDIQATNISISILEIKSAEIKRILRENPSNLAPRTNRYINDKLKTASTTIIDIRRHLSETKKNLQLQISEFYNRRNKMDTIISQVNTLFYNLENIIKSNYSVLKEYSLIRSCANDLINIENNISECVVLEGDYLVVSSDDLVEFNNAKTGCEELIGEWWDVFGTIRNEVEDLQLTEFNGLNDSIDTLLVKIRMGDYDGSELTVLYNKYKNVADYISDDQYLSSKIKQYQFKWNTAYAEACRLLNPVRSSNVSTEGCGAISTNVFKRTHSVVRRNNTSILKNLRSEQRKIITLCLTVIDSNATLSNLGGIRLNLNGTFGQFKLNVKSLDKEHLTPSSKRVIDKTVQDITVKYLEAKQLIERKAGVIE